MWKVSGILVMLAVLLIAHPSSPTPRDAIICSVDCKHVIASPSNIVLVTCTTSYCHNPPTSDALCSVAPRCKAAPLLCAQEGVYPDPFFCTVYHTCRDVGGYSTPAQCTEAAYNVATGDCDLPLDDPVCDEPVPECVSIIQFGVLPLNTNYYYRCRRDVAIFYPQLYQCPLGLQFNPDLGVLGSCEEPTTEEPTTEDITTTKESTTEVITTTKEPTTEGITTMEEQSTEAITTTEEPTTEDITTTKEPTTEDITTTKEPTTEYITTTEEQTTDTTTHHGTESVTCTDNCTGLLFQDGTISPCDSLQQPYCHGSPSSEAVCSASARCHGAPLLCAQEGVFPDPYFCTLYHACATFSYSEVLTCSDYGYNIATGRCDLPLDDDACTGTPVEVCVTLPQDGALAANRNYYYTCEEDGRVLYPLLRRCPEGQEYDDDIGACL